MLRRLQGELIRVPGQAQIREQRDRHEGVTQQAHEDRRATEPVKILSLEDVDDAGQRERAGGDRDPDQVEDDPEAPRIGVGEVGAAAEAEGEARHKR